MPRTQATDWWTDAQDQHEDLAPPAGRNPLEWSDEDFDLVPAVVGDRGAVRAQGFVHVEELSAVRRRRFARDEDSISASRGRDILLTTSDQGTARDVVVTTTDESIGREVLLTAAPAAAAVREIVVTTGEQQAPAQRRTVQITGNPERRRPPMTPQERVAHRPDRIAMWAAVFGFVLLLVALASSSDASAATLAL